MPEGPSLVIAKEEMSSFVGKKVVAASGNVKTFDPEILVGKKITDIKTWGKHLLICFPKFTVRVHFLMFGTYMVNDTKDRIVRLHLGFAKGEINFYTAAVKLIDEPLDEVYDWSADVMSDEWDAKAALKKLKAKPDMLACDALLDQNIFSGSGNIIKNEVLFRIKVHPESKLGAIPAKKLKDMVDEVVNYSFQFLEWKKAYVLKKHWLAHTKKTCPRDKTPLIKQHLGKTDRRSFFCPVCQVLYQ
jgi:endonuclease VIII